MPVENSGLSCSYYEVQVNYPIKDDKQPYLAECGDITEALEMTPHEANIFKEIWRSAAARQGRKKKGNTPLRSAEKILFFAQRIYTIAKRG